ncbi:hypothetical protein [Pseudomonas reidholzensis]
MVVRALAPIATAGLDKDGLPALIEQCRAAMQQCLDQLHRELG